MFIRRRGMAFTYKINLYRYGELWKTVSVIQGSSVVVGACNVAYDDDIFAGWSVSSTSTTRTYTATSSIKVTSDINLYAVFKYYTTIQTNITLVSSKNGSIDRYTYNLGRGTVRIAAQYIYVNQYGGHASSASFTSSQDKLISLSGGIFVQCDNYIFSSSTSISSTTGQILTIAMKGASESSFYQVSVFYPKLSSALYRVERSD